MPPARTREREPTWAAHGHGAAVAEGLADNRLLPVIDGDARYWHFESAGALWISKAGLYVQCVQQADEEESRHDDHSRC